jgi:hypothetical protein
LADVSARVIAFGHLHYTSLRRWGDFLLVNVAPCKKSPYDDDHRARFTVFTWAKGDWKVERHYVDYDLHQEGLALLSSDIPGKENKASLFLEN